MATAVAAVAATGCGGAKPRERPSGPAPAALTVTGAGSALTRITNGEESEWRAVLSADSHMLLFEVDTVTRAPNGGTVTRAGVVGINPNSTQARTLLTPPTANAGFPSWMPDSKGIVYAGDSMGPPALLRTASDTPGSAVTMIVGNTMAANPSQPSVSPSGKWVAFSTQARDVWNIAVVGMDGSHLTMLGEGSMPAWSPDEKKIVFSRTVSGNKQLFLMNPLTGGELVQITNEGGNFGPAYSPDGRWIVFSSNRAGGGGNNIFAVRPDGTGLTKLTETNGAAHRPHWGHDGFIYFDWSPNADGSGNSDIWRFQPVGDLAAPGTGATGGGSGVSTLPPSTPSSPPGTPSSPPGTPSSPPGSPPPPTPPAVTTATPPAPPAVVPPTPHAPAKKPPRKK